MHAATPTQNIWSASNKRCRLCLAGQRCGAHGPACSSYKVSPGPPRACSTKISLQRTDCAAPRRKSARRILAAYLPPKWNYHHMPGPTHAVQAVFWFCIPLLHSREMLFTILDSSACSVKRIAPARSSRHPAAISFPHRPQEGGDDDGQWYHPAGTVKSSKSFVKGSWNHDPGV